MRTSTTRRTFLASGSTLLAMPILAAGQAPPVAVTTYTYKRVDGLEIKADVHCPDDGVTRPVVVWIHGGALINGHRAGIDSRVRSMVLDAGFALVSIDYRLAPETKLPAIIEDLEDAFAWVRTEGPALVHADARRITTMGSSAGGYLTLTAGFRVKPAPVALVAFWGYGDLIGDWYSKPSPHPRHHRSTMSAAEARQQVSGPPLSDSRNRAGNGGAFYQYCRQHGLWPQEVSGWNPHSNAGQFFPFMPVKNVTASYPPTLLIHGTADTDVPYEQSVMMAEQFKRHGVEYQLVSIPDGEHGLRGGAPKLIDQAYQTALQFLQRHTGQ